MGTLMIIEGCRRLLACLGTLGGRVGLGFLLLFDEGYCVRPCFDLIGPNPITIITQVVTQLGFIPTSDNRCTNR